LDEKSAKILLERSVNRQDDKLIYSRDQKLKYHVSLLFFVRIIIDFYFKTKFVHPEVFLFRKTMSKYITCPMLFIYSSAGFTLFNGESGLDILLEIIKEFKNANKSKFIQSIPVNGTHQFHMIDADNTSNIIMDFLNKANKMQNISKIISKL
jgi:hypothetical protein